MKPVFLIGFPASGKSTLGAAVAAATALRFIDLDSLIEEREEMAVADIFAAGGEPAFRQAEERALRSVAGLTDVVVACGGGAPCIPGMMQLMNESGLTVRLTASRPVLARRLAEAAGERPLVGGTDAAAIDRYITLTAQAREPFYSAASATFDTDRLESADEVTAAARLFASTFNLPLRP